MAAPVAWGVPPPSAWATQVDEEEREQGGEIKLAPVPVISEKPLIQVGGGEKAFPSLGDALKVKETKKKKKQAMNLGEFLNGKSATFQAGSARQASRKEEMPIHLPTGPRPRDGDDDQSSGLGGGFRGGFDNSRPSRGGFRGDASSDGGSQRGDDGPSRADISSDWGQNSKYQAGSGGAGGRSGGGFGGGFRSRDGSEDGRNDDGPSRADQAASWGSSKFVPSAPSRGGFDDRPSRGGFDDRRERGYEFTDRESSRADNEERWGHKPAPVSESRSGSGAYDDNKWGNPRRGVSDLPPSDSAPVGRRRLNLAPRTKPPPEIVVVKQPEVQAPVEEDASKAPNAPRPKVNPFGAARPREEVLKEKEAAKGADGAAEEVKEEAKAKENGHAPVDVEKVGDVEEDDGEPPAEEEAAFEGVPSKTEEPPSNDTTPHVSESKVMAKDCSAGHENANTVAPVEAIVV